MVDELIGNSITFRQPPGRFAHWGPCLDVSPTKNCGRRRIRWRKREDVFAVRLSSPSVRFRCRLQFLSGKTSWYRSLPLCLPLKYGVRGYF